jgi:hypothetical protein
VSHCGLAIYIKKYLNAKEELWKLRYFTMQKYSLQKSSKRNPNPSSYYNSMTNLKFQHKPKYPKDPTWVTNPALISYLLGDTNIVKLNNHTRHLTSIGGEE